MYRYPEMKEFYLIMDNSPIHDKKKTVKSKKITESRDYQCVYIPPYFSELNPIEQFWAVVKSKLEEVSSEMLRI